MIDITILILVEYNELTVTHVSYFAGSSEYAPLIKENANATHQQALRVRILNSKVISASLGKGRHIQLSQPIRLVLKHLLTDNVTNPTCVFWNYIDQYAINFSMIFTFR